MAWSGSGVFARIHNWINDRDAAINITASRMDAEDDNLAAGINACLAKNGENAATGNLDIGGFRLTNVANGSASTDAATVAQVRLSLSGTTTFSSVGSLSISEQTIAQSLGSDDLDFQASVFGSDSVAGNGSQVYCRIYGTDKRYSDFGAEYTTSPTVAAVPSSGNIKIVAGNNAGSSQDVTVKWTITKRS